MWLKKTRPMSEHGKEAARERQFRATVMEKVRAIPPGQWQKTDRSYDTEQETGYGKRKVRHEVIVYEAISNGVKVHLSMSKDSYEEAYSLELDNGPVDRYRYFSHDDGYSGNEGNEQVRNLYWQAERSVAILEGEKARPVREARAAEASRNHAKRAAEEEKKRQDILRRL